jgi:hypothetical protein
VSSNGSTTGISPGAVFSTLPAGLRDSLLEAFNEIARNYAQRRWEPAELNGGKLCEVAYSILRGIVDGTFPATPSKPRNMVDACRALETESSSIPRSIRIQIPRMLMALYEVRNNRGVGHVGGDVDPNHMDAVAVLYMAKWVMAELVRNLHSVDTEKATELVEALIEREVPIVWSVGDVKRVLEPGMPRTEAVLVLLHSSAGPVDETDLARWVEHPKLAQFRRDVLRPLHKARLVEFDQSAGTVTLSPRGTERIEAQLSA